MYKRPPTDRTQCACQGQSPRERNTWPSA